MAQAFIAYLNISQQRACVLDTLPLTLILERETLGKSRRITFKLIAHAHDLHALLDILGRCNLNRQTKAIQQLRTQLAFLRVATADQDKARAVANAQAITFNHIDTGHGHVEKYIHNVIFEQVDLIDVQKTSVSRR